MALVYHPCLLGTGWLFLIKKQLEIAAASVIRRIGTLLSNPHDSRGEKKATDTTISAWNPFHKGLQKHQEITVSKSQVAYE